MESKIFSKGMFRFFSQGNTLLMVYFSFVSIVGVLVSCSSSSGLLRTPDSFNEVLRSKALICAQFDIRVSSEKNLAKKVGVNIDLFSEKSGDNVRYSTETISTYEDRQKFFYVPIEPGTYGLQALSLSLSQADVPLNVMFTGYKYNWRLGVIFEYIDKIEISAGDVVYIGSYKLYGGYDADDWPHNYVFRSMQIEDNFDDAQKDLSTITGGLENKITKKIGLLNDRLDLHYRLLTKEE